MLLRAEGLFRLDVTLLGDTVKTVVRNLSASALETRGPATKPGGVSIGLGDVRAYEPGRVEFEFALGQREDRVKVTGMIATVRVTGQAIIRPAPAE
jgi:hypothetical protein